MEVYGEFVYIMGKLFGTDGVRGVANKEITGELAYKIARAGSYYLNQNYLADKKPVFLIGKDTRISGDMLEAALSAGLNSVGVDVIKLGIIPTPGVSFLTKELNVQGGIMISASHNPIEDNGIKFFNSEGYKLSDEMENEIENILFNNYDSISMPTHKNIGRINDNLTLVEKYKNYLKSTVELDFTGMKIVIDCANGAAYKLSPQVFSELGAEVIKINDTSCGEKINVECGSTNPDLITQKVLENRADIGIAHDGDADRVIMVDEKGKLLDGDQIMAIAALDMLKRGKLKGKTLVTTSYSNMGLKEVLNKNDVDLFISNNGDRYILKAMLDNNFNFGGEKSGHIIFLDYNRTGDGILTALQLTQIVKRSNKALSSLKVMNEWPQILKSVKVKYKKKWKENIRIDGAIKKAEDALAGKGRVFIRASGTEPVIRVMVEGRNDKLIDYWAKKLCDIINEELN
jgi:phosphoglucosamine mutase